MATSNYTAINIDNMVAVEPHAVLFTGDLCYAGAHQRPASPTPRRALTRASYPGPQQLYGT